MRRADNFIAIKSVGPTSRFFNKKNVNVVGSETNLKVAFKEHLFLSANTTFQNINDHTGARLPNIPYLFGHLTLGYKKDEFIKQESKLQLYLSANLKQEFFLISPLEGSIEFKHIIPSQSNIDFTCNYSFKKDRYRISGTVVNIFNQKLYDNFRIQKPGRSFRIQFTYFLKQNK